jgi:hypothetical protein
VCQPHRSWVRSDSASLIALGSGHACVLACPAAVTQLSGVAYKQRRVIGRSPYRMPWAYDRGYSAPNTNALQVVYSSHARQWTSCDRTCGTQFE